MNEQTVPPRSCDLCRLEIRGIFYIRYGKVKPLTLCERCKDKDTIGL